MLWALLCLFEYRQIYNNFKDAENFYGIKDVELIKATGLDIYGVDEKTVLKEAMKGLESWVNLWY